MAAPKTTALGLLMVGGRYGCYCPHCGDYFRSEVQAPLLSILSKGCLVCRKHGAYGGLAKGKGILVPDAKTDEGEWVS